MQFKSPMDEYSILKSLCQVRLGKLRFMYVGKWLTTGKNEKKSIPTIKFIEMKQLV